MLKRIVAATRSSRTASLCQLLLNLLAAATLVAVAAVLIFIVTQPSGGLIGYLGRIALIAIGGAALISLFSSLAELYGQHARDLRAAAIFSAVRDGGPPPRPYTLYLRPFASTDLFAEHVLSAAGANVSAGQGFLYGGTARVELEAQLELATRPFGELIALGEPLEHVGAGRVLVDESTWQNAVQSLTEHAELIVLLPSSRPGTLWEIERILDSNLIERTVLIDAPNSGEKAQGAFAQSAEWAQVRDAFIRRGYDMPPDSKDGVLLFFGRAKSPQASARLDIDAEDNIRRFFKRALNLRTAQTEGVLT
jgi:hypothetical protein